MHIHYGKDKVEKYRYIADRDYKAIKDTFLRDTLKVLDYLYTNDIMTVTYNKNKETERTVDIIDELINEAPESIHIKKGDKNQYFPATNTILFKHTHGAVFRKDYKRRFSGSNIGYNSPMALFAHEIIHCYHELFDANGYHRRKADHSMKGKKINKKGTDLSFPNREEELVIRLTNQVTKRLGEDKRRHYGRNYYEVKDVLSIKKKESLA